MLIILNTTNNISSISIFIKIEILILLISLIYNILMNLTLQGLNPDIKGLIIKNMKDPFKLLGVFENDIIYLNIEELDLSNTKNSKIDDKILKKFKYLTSFNLSKNKIITDVLFDPFTSKRT